jgi:maltooligosyltrehalose trehalohydrolase
LVFERSLGATYLGNSECWFRVWAPFARKVEVHITSPENRIAPMTRDGKGHHSALVTSVSPGTTYYYRLDEGAEYPDPASRYQPQGVHGPSQIVDPSFPWGDRDWCGISLETYVIYELHVGSFTPAGTFKAVIPFLDELKELGITALEIMPVAQFPGRRNWGYDGVFPFAVQDSYGGPHNLKQLVNACHTKGLAVILDVVYNHLGPEGCVFDKFGPYFTDSYRTPWGKAINFDQAFSDEVRHFFKQNAAYWITDFHIDSLRLDALHAIFDVSASPFLAELGKLQGDLSRKLNRSAFLIGESDSNDRRVVLPAEYSGYGINCQWNEDFHHALYAILTGERRGYYRDFGRIGQLAKAFREGFVFSGQYSGYRRRKHGSSSKDIPAERHVVFIQNHDQVGNRAIGERLAQLVAFEKLKLAAGTVILSPFVPLIFMGEEFADPAPFRYFVDHSDPALIKAVREGRRREFSSFQNLGKLPDPQAEQTFLATKLNHALKNRGKHRVLLDLYREMLRLRRDIPALAHLSKSDLYARSIEKTRLLYVLRGAGNLQALIVYNFSDCRRSANVSVQPGLWEKRLDTAEVRWSGRGNRTAGQLFSRGKIEFDVAPNSCVLFTLAAEED